MTAPAYTDRERQARALLAEEANRILLQNPSLISARVQICSDSGRLTWVELQDHIGEMHNGFGLSLGEATAHAMQQIKDARTLAAQKREEAAKLLADAARLEQSAAA